MHLAASHNTRPEEKTALLKIAPANTPGAPAAKPILPPTNAPLISAPP